MTGRRPAVPPGFTLLALDAIDSTNEEALRQAEAGAPDGLVVWAREQTAGRGRRGRGWVSSRGNCFSSVLLRPMVPPLEAARLSFLVAVAVAEMLDRLLPGAARIGCKWPNDVLVDGAKISGILLESRMSIEGRVDRLIIGTGINVASAPEGTAYATTSMTAHGAVASVEAVLEGYLERLAAWLGRWRAGGFAPVREAWIARADGLGKPVRVMLPDGAVDGVFESLDESGAMVLRGENGERTRITAGDVYRPA
ncbi:MAG: biotin--[acetyl-CoA-carboxylase] ligase [Alphaproteobacteria bacterium]|nr:biotin--[acetyl-CoA-carboxylase] ligase [Alphaproteobacteria bacterium]